MNEDKAREALRAAFEADAEPMGFDLTRHDPPLPVPEPWSEYVDAETGHRWAGWLACAALQWAASQQAAEGWRQIGWTCGDGDCGRIHDGPSTDDDYTQAVYVRAAPPSTQGGADEQR